MINFYLPLLVLIGLNGRIYYEIKRRYKNVFLQRLSTKSNEPGNNFKLTPTRKDSRVPIAVSICDGDRPVCSTNVDHTENDTLLLPQYSSTTTDLRMNFKEKKALLPIPIHITHNPTSSISQTYSFAENNHCTQVISIPCCFSPLFLLSII